MHLLPASTHIQIIENRYENHQVETKYCNKTHSTVCAPFVCVNEQRNRIWIHICAGITLSKTSSTRRAQNAHHTPYWFGRMLRQRIYRLWSTPHKSIKGAQAHTHTRLSGFWVSWGQHKANAHTMDRASTRGYWIDRWALWIDTSPARIILAAGIRGGRWFWSLSIHLHDDDG